MTSTKIYFYIFLSVIFLLFFTTSCNKCKDCSLKFSEEQLNWLNYEDEEIAYFSNEEGQTMRLQFLHTSSLNLSEVCGRKDLMPDCLAREGQKIYEVLDPQTGEQAFAGDTYVELSDNEANPYRGVFTIWGKQIIQNGNTTQDFILGVPGDISQLTTFMSDGVDYSKVYQFDFEPLTNGGEEQCIQIIYQRENGLLGFSFLNGETWYLLD